MKTKAIRLRTGLLIEQQKKAEYTEILVKGISNNACSAENYNKINELK